jgi:hypothetical protein
LGVGARRRFEQIQLGFLGDAEDDLQLPARLHQQRLFQQLGVVVGQPLLEEVVGDAQDRVVVVGDFDQ